ncbi:MAG: sodium/glucose cotransporter, partial [Bacteroidota bacterium]
MNAGFTTLDYVVFAIYVVTIVAVGLYLSRGKKGEERSGEDYFLAGRNLTWWAIGASLIAANISAEHFIGMSGSGYALGLGIAAYEWMAAITLILVAKFFLPIFLKKGIYTTNQFLVGRFNQGVSSAFAVMWLMVYVFVNLTTVTYLGALAMQEILGIPVLYGIIGLAIVAGVYSIYGGLTAVAWTDVIQVIFL